MADAELSEKFRVLCSALVAHQEVGVNLQQHKVRSAKIPSSVLDLVGGAGGEELRVESSAELVRSHPPEVRPQQGTGRGGRR